MIHIFLILALLFVGCGESTQSSLAGANSFGFFRWKAVLMTGDDSINAFDNARKKVAEVITNEGVEPSNIIHLSRSSSQQVGGVKASSAANFRQAFVDQNLNTWDACFAFITSHGSRSGFYIRGQSDFTPAAYNSILQDTCGDRPTVILVSACYSGIFAEPVMRKPNRIILTAASKDRTSFGCEAEATYTYWDGCLIDSFATPARTWGDLYASIKTCIERKEGAQGETPSQPQGFFGVDIANYPIFERF